VSSNFIVYFRDASWQYTHAGHIAANFESRDKAVAAAIEEARSSGDKHASVIVQDRDLQEKTVWTWNEATA